MLRALMVALVGWLMLLFAISCQAPGDGLKPTRPNIVLIMADDVGVEAFGCYGGTSYATPRLDKLAAGGVRFTNVYSQTLCTPSRVKLMTGRGNLRNYVHFSILDPRERTIGHVAREAGYRTAVVGKWQLLGAVHYGDWAGRGTHPRAAGFDEWCLWQVDALGSRYDDPTLEINGELHRSIEGAFGPDLFTEALLEFAARESDQPFFIYYPMALVHDPFVPMPNSAAGERSEQQNFADMVEYMDGIVGRIEDGLERSGVRDETLLIFVSDNGTHSKIQSMCDGELVRGGKTESTDAGTHVPMIVSWPRAVTPGVNSDLVDFSDFMPTLAAAMRAKLPQDVVLDGRSFLPQLLGREGAPREWITIYSNPRPPGNKRNPRVCFARDQRYKLYDDGRFFDCLEDPRELRPLDRNEPALQPALVALQAALNNLPPEPEYLRAPNR